MENSLANELYSEILQSSNVKVDPIPVANSKSFDLSEFDDDDVWDGEESIEKFDKSSDMNREWQTRRNQFHTIGYRDGVTSGQEASAQEGFNIGFKESVYVGFNWGLVRGVTSTLACLPNGLREKMIATEEKRKKYKELHESVCSLSTSDALKLFHADLSNKSGRNTETSSGKFDSEDQNCDGNNSPLTSYYRELESLNLDASLLKVNFKIHP